ncbi:MAG: metal-dependent hydrolase [Promethearchaeota archaeon]
MNGTAHASYSFLVFSTISYFLLHSIPTGGMCFLALLFGVFPDFDGIYWRIKKGKKAIEDTNTFQHHLYYPTHWPVSYIPILILTIFVFAFNFYPLYFLAITVGVYSHLIFDSISCGDGMNWGAPWGRRFINLFSEKTDGYHGLYWSARYKKTIFFKIENIAALISIFLLITYIFLRPSGWILYVVGIVGIVGFMISGFKPIDEKYLQEPPGGRYNDYRMIPEFYNKLPEKNKEKIRKWREEHPCETPKPNKGRGTSEDQENIK